MRVKYVKAGGVNTRYLIAGEGPPLILLHGVGLSGDGWIRNIVPLAQGRTIIAMDMLNHGFTDFVSYGNDAPQKKIVEHVLAFIDALGYDRFSIGGSSFGAQIATLVYFAAKDRVDNLIIVGSGTSFNSEAELAVTLPRVLQNAVDAYNDPTWESCRRRMANVVFNPEVVPDEILLSQLTSYARPGMADAYQRTLKGMMDLERVRRYRFLERLEQITVRTLIIWGRQDSRGAVERAIEASRRIPNCELVIFEECGHFPYMEHPQRFNDTISRFLGA